MKRQRLGEEEAGPTGEHFGEDQTMEDYAEDDMRPHQHPLEDINDSNIHYPIDFEEEDRSNFNSDDEEHFEPVDCDDSPTQQPEKERKTEQQQEEEEDDNDEKDKKGIKEKEKEKQEEKEREDSLNHRNMSSELEKTRDAFAAERAQTYTDLEKAMMFIQKLSLLHQIPHGVIDLLLQTSSLKKLQLLEGYNMQLIDRKLDQIRVSIGSEVKLGSGTTVRYLPIPKTLLRSAVHGAKEGKDITVYWDGFRKFAAKGGTLGTSFPISCCLQTMLSSDSFIYTQVDFTSQSKRTMPPSK